MNDKIQDLLDSRRSIYGDVTINMDSVAEMVNGYLNGVEQRTGERKLEGIDFAMVMVLYKCYRFAVTPEYGDNLDDVEGYVKIIRQMMGDKIVAAKNPTEYHEATQSTKEPTFDEIIQGDDPRPSVTECLKEGLVVLLCERHAQEHPYSGGNLQVVAQSGNCARCSGSLR